MQSTLKYFRDEYLAHVVGYHCPICNKEKPHSTIDAEKCRGCGKCRKNCPMEAITGAATIFGTTGGVAEAVARRVMEDKSRNTLQALEFSGLRGSETIREVSLPAGDRVLHIAIVHGLVHAKKLLADIEAGAVYYELVEVMTRKTGCVGGAGQPWGLIPVKQQRAAGLYEADRNALIKRSESNPIVAEMMAGPLKGRTHELLHVHYQKK